MIPQARSFESSERFVVGMKAGSRLEKLAFPLRTIHADLLIYIGTG
jgi:hypothetical protein